MKNSFIRLILLVFIIPVLSISAQIEKEKWKASNILYQKGTNSVTSQIDSSYTYIDALKFVYKNFISDVDGDNCPFQPSCSSFFVKSVKSTNFFQGLLMGADRLTRDINLVKDHYPITHDGHFLDPSENYLLDKN